ncbi:BLOC-1-related complex subunit 6 isoform X2 [Photinus pyralis]|uniref:BLOC-1-related complex subunit 6 C-terminal helix domain-containing protein n=1 Tax=Photinus pyralis TaxID=7054 RepID=A0A1Y1LLD2_PHOPY|nr:BLOC-1-related complex subunit 6 isoform X2 [Photinus pyralis]
MMDSDDNSLSSPPGPPKDPPPSLPPPLPARPPKVSSLPTKLDHFEDPEIEGDDEISQQMTASYSEISFKSELSPDDNELSLSLSIDPLPSADEMLKRPKTLPCERNNYPGHFHPLNLEGTVHVEGNMTHFVTEDLEYKIKLSSPVNKKGDTPPLPGNSKIATPNTLFRQLLVPQMGLFDTGLLNDLESEAQRMATSIDNLTENLCGILHSISSITADNVDVYKDAVSKMSDTMDANIKSMYTMMAKAEEVTQAMKTVQNHSVRIKEIRRLVDIFESFI